KQQSKTIHPVYRCLFAGRRSHRLPRKWSHARLFRSGRSDTDEDGGSKSTTNRPKKSQSVLDATIAALVDPSPLQRARPMACHRGIRRTGEARASPVLHNSTGTGRTSDHFTALAARSAEDD